MIDFDKKIPEDEIIYYSEKLSSWKKLNLVIEYLSEDGLTKALLVELQTKKRYHIIQRLKGKLNVLRNKNELEIIKKIMKK